MSQPANKLIELPVQLYKLFSETEGAPRIYAIGARGYLVDYFEFKTWQPPQKSRRR